MKKYIYLACYSLSLLLLCSITASAQKTVSAPIPERKEEVGTITIEGPVADALDPGVPVPPDETPEQNEIFTYVEQMPEFPGGLSAMNLYLSRNIRYPEDALKKGIQGKVIIRFVVDKTGELDDIQVIRSIYPSLDAEAKRVIKAMPKWKPGKQNGRVVRTSFTIPVSFRTE